MRILYLFMMVTLDGYFEGPGHDIAWHNAKSEEFQRLAAERAVEADAILMGRTTYDLMKAFWPTAAAAEVDPLTAAFMNETPKYVVSHAAFDPGWRHVTVIHEDMPAQISALKAGPGRSIVLLGSNELCVSLMKEGLVDEFRLVVNPVVLASGTPLFAGLNRQLNLSLVASREFASGNVLLTYRS